jgi:hypothetical protein
LTAALLSAGALFQIFLVIHDPARNYDNSRSQERLLRSNRPAREG